MEEFLDTVWFDACCIHSFLIFAVFRIEHIQVNSSNLPFQYNVIYN